MRLESWACLVWDLLGKTVSVSYFSVRSLRKPFSSLLLPGSSWRFQTEQSVCSWGSRRRRRSLRCPAVQNKTCSCSVAPVSSWTETQERQLSCHWGSYGFLPETNSRNDTFLLVVQQHVRGEELEAGGVCVSFDVVVHAGQLERWAKNRLDCILLLIKSNQITCF